MPQRHRWKSILANNRFQFSCTCMKTFSVFHFWEKIWKKRNLPKCRPIWQEEESWKRLEPFLLQSVGFTYVHISFVSQILRAISFRDFLKCEISHFKNFEALNFDFLWLFALLEAYNLPNQQNWESHKWQKWQF